MKETAPLKETEKEKNLKKEIKTLQDSIEISNKKFEEALKSVKEFDSIAQVNQNKLKAKDRENAFLREELRKKLNTLPASEKKKIILDYYESN